MSPLGDGLAATCRSRPTEPSSVSMPTLDQGVRSDARRAPRWPAASLSRAGTQAQLMSSVVEVRAWPNRFATVRPYTPGAGRKPRTLAGRDEELEPFVSLVERLGAGTYERSPIYTGLRGVGKTVLLWSSTSWASRAPRCSEALGAWTEPVSRSRTAESPIHAGTFSRVRPGRKRLHQPRITG